MGFKELVKRVQIYSGFTDEESKDALELMVESIAVRLEESKRRDFASQLPELLSDIALSVLPSEENTKGDLINQFIEYEHLEKPRARLSINATWRALREVMPDKIVNQIISQLPNSSIGILR